MRPKDLDSAQQFVGRKVLKDFLPDDNNRVGRQFKGEVIDLLREDDGNIVYEILYCDGDQEHVEWDELCQIMQPNNNEGAGRASGKRRQIKKELVTSDVERDHPHSGHPSPHDAQVPATAAAGGQRMGAAADGTGDSHHDAQPGPSGRGWHGEAGPSSAAAGQNGRRRLKRKSSEWAPGSGGGGGLLNVICGSLAGQLDLATLHVHLEDGQLVGGSEYERLAGRGASKKWKVSARVVEPDGRGGRTVKDYLDQQQQQQTQQQPLEDNSGDDAVGNDTQRPAAAAAAAAAAAVGRRGQDSDSEQDADMDVQDGQHERDTQPGRRASTLPAHSARPPQPKKAKGGTGRRGATVLRDATNGQDVTEIAPLWEKPPPPSVRPCGHPVFPDLREEGLPGMVRRVKVENFMCHENFLCDFGVHVTLISGSNGSGKSAALQALQVCLGANARDTSRGSGLSGFIRTGAVDARVQVTLWNRGPFAYKHEIYGDWIKIERRITASNSPFKLMDAWDKVVSTSRKEKDAILKFFNVNATNPLNIITQDMARSFFEAGTGDKRRKFEIWMEGTRLEDILAEHAKASTELNENRRVLKMVQANLKEHLAALEEVKKQQAKLEGVRGLKELREQLEVACIVVTRQDIQALMAPKVHFLEVETPARRAQLMGEAAEVDDFMQQLQQLEQQKSAILQQRVADNEQHVAQTKVLKDAVSAAIKAVKVAQTQVNKMTSKRAQLSSTQQDLRQRLNAERPGNEAVEAQRQAHQQHEALVAEKQAEIENLKDAFHEAQRGYAALKAERLPPVQQRFEAATQREQYQESRIHPLLADLRNLEAHQRSGGQNVAAFGGQAITRLVSLVAARGNLFSRPPLGPVGSFLGLKDSKWSTAVESGLGYMLNMWLVNSKADVKTLLDLARSAGCSMNGFSVYQCPFGLPKHRVNQLQEHCTSLLSVLSCLDPTKEAEVMNFLVDKARVEETALVESAMEGRANLYQNASGSSVRKSIDVLGLAYVDRGTTKVVMPYRARGPPRLGMDLSQQIAQMRELIAAEQAQLADAQAETRAAKHDVAAVLAEVNVADREQNIRSRAHTVARQELQRLMRAAPAPLDMGDVDEEVLALTTQLEDIRQEVDSTASELQALQDALRAEKEREAEARARLEQHTAHFEQRMADMTLHDELKQVVEQQREAAARKAHVRGLLDQLDATEAAEKQALEDLRSQVEGVDNHMEANNFTEELAAAAMSQLQAHFTHEFDTAEAPKLQRLHASADIIQQHREQYVAGHMTYVELEKLDKSLQRKITATESAVDGKPEDLDRDEKRLSKICAKLEGQGRANEYRYQKLLLPGYNARAEKFIMLRDTTLERASLRFRTFLQRRGFDGYIEMDYERQELTLGIHKDSKNLSNPVEDLKQLSGGERSYVTVAFLLAVGKQTESPFSCMDEYDVFMDTINRRAATETLLEYAMEDCDRQFILLTPQDVETVEAARVSLENRKKVSLPDEFLRKKTVKPARPGAAAGPGQ